MGVASGPHLLRRARRRDAESGGPAIALGFTLEWMAQHSPDFRLLSEDLPDPNNRVTLDRDGHVVLTYQPNNEEWHKRLIGKLKSLMKRQRKCSVQGHKCHVGLFARSLYVGQSTQLTGVAHQNGTIRFGRDPKTSALNATARPTVWTTPTSLTRASSRPVARCIGP
jgi:hypothetical protein